VLVAAILKTDVNSLNTTYDITSSSSGTLHHWINYTVSGTQVFQHLKENSQFCSTDNTQRHDKVSKGCVNLEHGEEHVIHYVGVRFNSKHAHTLKCIWGRS